MSRQNDRFFRHSSLNTTDFRRNHRGCKEKARSHAPRGNAVRDALRPRRGASPIGRRGASKTAFPRGTVGTRDFGAVVVFGEECQEGDGFARLRWEETKEGDTVGGARLTIETGADFSIGISVGRLHRRSPEIVSVIDDLSPTPLT